MKQMLASGLLLGASLINNVVAQEAICGSATLSEDNNMMISLYVYGDAGSVAITLTGPGEYWYGVGFGASTMANTYAIITEGDGAVSEYKLGSGNAGTQLEDSVESLSSEVFDGVRYAYYYRSLDGSDSDYYTFDASTTSINLIWATSDSSSFTQHTSQGTATINLSEDECPDTNFTGTFAFTSTEMSMDSSSDSMDNTESSDDDDDSEDSTVYCGTVTLSEDNSMSASLYMDDDEIVFALSGPSDYWYGVGFGSTTMSGTYAIITEGDGAVSEYKLGSGVAGTLLTDSVTSVSSTTADSVRTAYYYRTLAGADSDYYTFDTSATSINLIWATSESSTFTVHTAQGSTSITIGTDDCPSISDFTDTASSSSDEDDDDDDDDDDAAYQSNIIVFGYLIASLYVFAQMI